MPRFFSDVLVILAMVLAINEEKTKYLNCMDAIFKSNQYRTITTMIGKTPRFEGVGSFTSPRIVFIRKQEV